ncbi:MAG: EAL domain-containing protein, partial [Parahaliea sp.]
KWILHQACAAAVGLFQAQQKRFRLAVNFSAPTFLQEDVVEMVSDVLAVTGLPASYLEIEVTEGVLVDDYSIARKHLDRLRKLGVSLAIDDFGTGYSSLAYLRYLNVDVLKIDKCFIDEIVSNAGDRAIVNSIFALGDVLGLKLIVEGVERQEQLDYLVSCYGEQMVVQGYLFSKPLPVSELLSYLQAARHR